MLPRFRRVRLCGPVICPRQAPLSTGLSGQEYRTGLPFPPPEDLPDPGTEPVSPAASAPQADPLLEGGEGAKGLRRVGHTVGGPALGRVQSDVAPGTTRGRRTPTYGYRLGSSRPPGLAPGHHRTDLSPQKGDLSVFQNVFVSCQSPRRVCMTTIKGRKVTPLSQLTGNERKEEVAL